MAGYYNELDTKASAWLRELIRHGLIADGEVDERSILEAHLAMKKRMGERDGTGADRTAITDLQVMAKTGRVRRGSRRKGRC